MILDAFGLKLGCDKRIEEGREFRIVTDRCCCNTELAEYKGQVRAKKMQIGITMYAQEHKD